MLITEPTVKEENGNKKIISITVALVVQLVIALVFVMIVTRVGQKQEPELVAQVVANAKENEPKMEKKTVMKQVKQASAASAASPIAKMIRSNTTARIVAPKVTKVTDGPLGLGEGDFGDGFGSGSGSGMGSGGTMFGRAAAGGMVGRLFDLKQDGNRKAKAYDPSPGSYFGIIRDLEKRKFSDAAMKPYYQASVKLGFTFLAIPNMDANEGPKAFQAEKEIQPKGWFVHYQGKVDPPEDGLWRFHGMFDDLLVVFVNGRAVLDASWDPALNEPRTREISKQPTFMSSRPIYQGTWVNIKRGSELVILVGERPGGRLGGTLMIEKKGENYNERPNGSPIIPLFSTSELSKSDWKRVETTGYQYEKRRQFFPKVVQDFDTIPLIPTPSPKQDANYRAHS